MRKQNFGYRLEKPHKNKAQQIKPYRKQKNKRMLMVYKENSQ